MFWVGPEGVLELPLHGLHVGVLHEEGGAQLAELTELDLARAVLVDLGEQVLQLVLGGPEAHGAHDLPQVVRGQELLLLGVEQVKADLGPGVSLRTRKENCISYLDILPFYCFFKIETTGSCYLF